MKRFVFTFAILLSFGVLLFAAEYPPGEVLIDFGAKVKPPVKFQHETHVVKLKLECKECHHTLEKDGIPEPCRNCHTVKKDPKEPKKPVYKDALHDKCRKCHMQKAKEKYPGMSKKCTFCHVVPEASKK